MLRGKNCDDWVRNLNSLICIDMGTNEGLFNSNTDNGITLVKLWESYYCYQMDYKRSTLSSDVYVFSVMSTYSQCIPLHFCVMSVSCVLLMNGAAILSWMHMLSIFFSMIVELSNVEPLGSGGLDFGSIYFGTSARQSDVEPPRSWRSEFGPTGSLIMLGLVSPSPWFIMLSVRNIIIQ